jgi:hypothetical protein
VRFPRPVLAPIAAGLAVSTFAATWTFGMAAAGLAASDQPVTASAARAAEWWLAKLGVGPAWAKSKGTGITVAVLSDGANSSQPDLAGSVTTGPNLVVGAPGSGQYFGQLGTGLASLIAGHGHGQGATVGIMGIAPKAKILSVRVTLAANDPLLAQSSVAARLPGAIAAGIRYAVKHGAGVIDLPIDPGQPGVGGIGGAAAAAGGSPAERAAVRYALSHNVVLVAPAGDNGAGTDSPNFPAAYPGVIAVGSFNRNFTKSQWSSAQSYVAVTAAGTGVVAAANTGGYQITNSTSGASAVVAGIAALIRSRYPSLSVDQVRKALTSSTVFDNGSAGSGHGSVNAVRALTAAAYMMPVGRAAGAGAQPRTTLSPPRSARQSLPAILGRYGLISSGLLLVLLALIGAQALLFKRRARRQRQLVTQWAGRQAPSRYPHGSPGTANAMLEFFASPVAPPANTLPGSALASGSGTADRAKTGTGRGGSAQTGLARRKAATAQGIFAGASRPATGAQAPGRPVVSRVGGAPPAGLPGAPPAGGPRTETAGGGSGSAPSEHNARPAVSGAPPWEPAPMPAGALPWAAAADRGLSRDQGADLQAASAGVGLNAGGSMPAADRTERLSRARHAPAAQAAKAGQAVQMAQAAQHARRARQAERQASEQQASAAQGSRPGPPPLGPMPGSSAQELTPGPSAQGQAPASPAQGQVPGASAQGPASASPAHARHRPSARAQQRSSPRAQQRPSPRAQQGPSAQAPQRRSGFFRSVTGSVAGRSVPPPAPEPSGDELVEVAWPGEQGTPGYIRQSQTGRLDWREATPAGSSSPRQDPGEPLPVRQPRNVSQPGPLSPTGSLWERAVDTSERSAEGRDSGSRPIYVWDPGPNAETFPATPEELADNPARDAASRRF